MIGAALLAFGARDILTGTATTRWGRQVEGGEADMYGMIRLLAGIGCVIFGAYKVLEGLF